MNAKAATPQNVKNINAKGAKVRKGALRKANSNGWDLMDVLWQAIRYFRGKYWPVSLCN